MTNSILKSILFLFFIILISHTYAQSYSIGVIIRNQPDNKIILGLVKGDDLIPIDSAFAQNELVRFNMPENTQTGMYRLVLGGINNNTANRSGNQQIDFIFNNEDIVLETDFNSTESATRVIESSENNIWFRFKNKEKEYAKSLLILEKDVNYYWEKQLTRLVTEKANEYNRLQIERDLFIAEAVNNAKESFALKIIRTYKEPLLDGYLSKEQRKEIFQNDFLKTIDFSDEALIYTQAYTDKVFQYLLSFNQSDFTQAQREASYIKAINIIYDITNKNQIVSDFLKEYLIHGFTVLHLDNLVNYIDQKYGIE